MRGDDPRLQRRLTLAALGVVTIVGLWLLWPAPLGQPPVSKDHTVHLTRAWMWAQFLADGAPRGYSEIWFFGTPAGELYPILGDALVIAVRVLGLGVLDWHQAYAVAFTIVFVSQGWVMIRLANACGLGPIAGLLAGIAILVDPGAYREGGWIYTVDFGVWPQALANTMTYLALAEIVAALDATAAPSRARAIVRGALAAAGAMLAHQISLPVLVLASALVFAVFGLRRRAQMGQIAVVIATTVGLGFALAAWWVLPMLAMRGWMVSYGWLWQPLQWMFDHAVRGHLTQGMPAGVTVLVAMGTVLVAVRGSDGARAVVACGVVLWVWTSEDTLWRLRLDLLDRGFGQMQWQRFIIASKPGLFLAAAAAPVLLARAAIACWSRGGVVRALGVVPAAVVAVCVGWAARGQLAVMEEAEVGAVQIAIDPEDTALEDDYVQMAAHLRALWERDGKSGWRMTVTAARNQHWFMDLPVRTGIPLYKQGFTPGDNFVHKPEFDTPALLDRLGVRYVLSRRLATVRKADVVASFGQLRLWERRSWQPVAAARIDGAGTARVLTDDPAGGGIEVEVRGAAPGDRLVFDVAGYPRWELEHDGDAVEWFEAPAVGDGPDATWAERRRGDLLGGKAEGDDGTEPTLVAVAAEDGVWRLRYRVWRTGDLIAVAISLLAAVALGITLHQARSATRPPALTRAIDRAARSVRPAVLGVLVVAGVVTIAVRIGAGRAREQLRAVGWLDAGAATAQGARLRPFKTDMSIRPAIVAERKRIKASGRPDPRSLPQHPPATVRMRSVLLGERLTGWYAVADDDAKIRGEGKHRIVVEAGTGDAMVTLYEAPVRHEPGRVFIDVPTDALAGTRAEVVVTVHTEGHAPAPVGFDLDLGAPPP